MKTIHAPSTPILVTESCGEMRPHFPRNLRHASGQCLAAWLLLALFGMTPDLTAAEPPLLKYDTFLLGNTGVNGSTEAHIPWAPTDLFVSPNGILVYNNNYDEGCHCGTLFSPDGVKIGFCQYPMWASTGGYAVAADAKYLYLAMEQRNSGEPKKTWYPPADIQWYGVRQYPLTGSFKRDAVQFPGGLGPSNGEQGQPGADGSMLVTHKRTTGKKPEEPDTPVSGLAVYNNELYVSVPEHGKNRIRVYAVPFNGQKETRCWPLDSPGRLRFDSHGYLWVLRNAGTNTAAAIERYSTNGTKQAQAIVFPAEVKPSNFCTRGDDRILVTDAGVGSNIRIYKDITTTPVLETTFGASMYSGATPGAAGPQRFMNPTSIATDAANNMYIGSSPGGSVLEKYAPGGTRSWLNYNLCYQTVADFDPDNETEVYNSQVHFTLDYNALIPYKAGYNGSWKGITFNKVKYPDDVRWQSPEIFRFQGGMFMCVKDWGKVYIKRFGNKGEGECAVPCVSIHDGHIWRDLNGNGKEDPDEYQAGNLAGGAAPCVDGKGNIWDAAGQSIIEFPCQGADGAGNPIYTAASKVTTAAPEDFSEVRQVQYDASTDTMFLTGRTAANRGNPAWQSAGSIMRKYPRWSAGNRISTWTVALTQKADGLDVPTTIRLAGDYVFVGNLQTCVIYVYRTSDGVCIGRIDVPGDINKGWFDLTAGSFNARKRSNGDYIVFAEEQWCGKIIIYRWNPGGGPAGPAAENANKKKQ